MTLKVEINKNTEKAIQIVLSSWDNNVENAISDLIEVYNRKDIIFKDEMECLQEQPLDLLVNAIRNGYTLINE
ncbi:hypothetical protein [Bacillus sp. FJAT-22090]|uniref:hypothetical protein n=1 Tax=Bacillus sp. FJAT-22090 TaxID=1581038 RepID=UPI0011A1EB53|nr:hypothetical protein [Bacillus sp. FJAT-22090]